MSVVLEWIAKNIGYIVTICGAIAAAAKIISKPIKDYMQKINSQLSDIKAENKRQSEKLDNLDRDTADMLCYQLTREYDHFVSHGYCPISDKARINDIYIRYKQRGRNHLADHYVDDINNLPNTPQ